ncbi:MAG: VOC family protein [Solirubrobacteraceae bacterium]|nr:VOC family protein [Solirubrobacteraceae bacterium]
MATTPEPVVTGLRLGGGPDAWARAGFSCGAGGFRAGDVPVLVEPAREPSILLSTPGTSLDGAGSATPGAAVKDLPDSHSNGCCAVDHVVVLTPDFGRSKEAFACDGLQLRREREGNGPQGPVLQAFYVAGPCVIELVSPTSGGSDPGGPARVWGVTFVTQDLGCLPALDPPVVATIGEAVQPGRRIAVARAELGLPLPVAFMDPRNRPTAK